MATRFPKLNDSQVKSIVKHLRAFGYEKLTVEEVRKQADQVCNGTHSPTNVVAVMIEGVLEDLFGAK